MFDKNKFKSTFTIIDSNTFNYRHKISEFKYNGIKDLVNNIKNNTISKISAKEGLNILKQTRNVEIIKYKERTTHYWPKRSIKFIQRFIRYNFN